MTELALALHPSEFAVHVVCFHDDGVRAGELRERGVPILRLPIRSFRSLGAVKGAWVLGRYLRRHQIRIVHTFDLPLTCFGVPVARIFRAPVVLSSQRAHRDLQPRARRWIRWTDRWVDGIVVNCQAMRVHMLEDEGARAELIQVCYNWIDTQRFCPQPSGSAAHADRHDRLTNASLVIGVVCVLRPEKDLLTLINAFARLSATPRLALLVVGSGSMLEALESRARALGVLSQCLFQPEVSDVTPWLRQIDIFVLPSRSEALSNALMEAMACGCCVVASNVGGNPELVEDGQTGLLFRPGDAEDLATKLRRLIKDPAARASLGAKAACLIRERFDRQASVSRMTGIYWSYLQKPES